MASANSLKAKIITKLRSIEIKEYSQDEMKAAKIVGTGMRGSRADIYSVELSGGALVAVRCLSREIEDQVANANKNDPEWERREEKFFQYFERECTLWHNGSKESNDSRFSKIVKLLGFTASYDDRLFPSLILELYPDGTLRDVVMRIKDLGEKERVLLLRDVVSGIAYLHDPPREIVHRDIKGENILVRRRSDGSFSAAIADFGSAKLLNPQDFPILNSTYTGSPYWTPPEYIVDGRQDYSNPTTFGDVWSFGCTVIEALSGSDPWSGCRQKFMKYMHGELDADSRHPPRPICITHDSRYWNLLLSVFRTEPEERPTSRILEMDIQNIYDNL